MRLARRMLQEACKLACPGYAATVEARCEACSGRNQGGLAGQVNVNLK